MTYTVFCTTADAIPAKMRSVGRLVSLLRGFGFSVYGDDSVRDRSRTIICVRQSSSRGPEAILRSPNVNNEGNQEERKEHPVIEAKRYSLGTPTLPENRFDASLVSSLCPARLVSRERGPRVS